MDNAINLSGLEPKIPDIEEHHRDTQASIALYFSKDNPNAKKPFGSMPDEMLEQRRREIAAENALLFSLALLTAIEALFCMAYYQKCAASKDDSLSRALQEIHDKEKRKTPSVRTLFDAWEKHGNLPDGYIAQLNAAFDYRNWLAHGRYWDFSAARKYDYLSISQLAQIALKFLSTRKA